MDFIKRNTTINILGTTYTIKYKNYEEELDFKKMNACGLCDMMTKTISICNLNTAPDFVDADENYLNISYKETLRHEIMHAFLYESGLNTEGHGTSNWSTDEEIIDWFAIQSPKIFKVFESLGVN